MCFVCCYIIQMSSKIDPSDRPNAEKTQAIIKEIIKFCRDHTGSQDDLTSTSYHPFLPLAGLVAISAVIMTYYAYQKRNLS